jgi:putative DNA methylase
MTSTNKYRKKLIEVAIPLEAINAASAREKSIRHGHPSTLHLWWARRPLAACRAVLFAQLVDDPSGYADKLLDDPKIRARAEADLAIRLKAWRERTADAQGIVPDMPEPTLEDCAADIERKRLFEIIEELVIWENSTNEEVLERARAEIRRSCGGVLPPVYDPFSGGGSIPLEAQRLGLPAYGSDLNPVAVMIGKAMIEIPPKFKDLPPIHPGIKERNHYRNAEGLAEDVRYYGEWMREKAWERIGNIYPQVELPKEYGGGNATAVAWLWARTVRSPNPALGGAHVPLMKSAWISSVKGKEAWVETIVDRQKNSFTFTVHTSGQPKIDGTVQRTAAVCAISGDAIPLAFIQEEGKSKRIKDRLLAVVCETSGGKVFISPSNLQEETALSVTLDQEVDTQIDHWRSCTNCVVYGYDSFHSLFTRRQLTALRTFSDLVSEARTRVLEDSKLSGMRDDGISLEQGGVLATAYADAVALYLAIGVDRLADRCASVCGWDVSRNTIRNTFARQAIPMVWEYAEVNPFSDSSGNWSSCMEWIFKVLEELNPHSDGMVFQENAAVGSASMPNYVVSTDPPYYDNIPYSNLSDYFYIWLRRSLGSVMPELFRTLAVPKSEELVANQFRHGGKDRAEEFFLSGIRDAISNMARMSIAEYPSAIYYAFKQSEVEQEGLTSKGWATFLQAIIESGYAIVGTWPVRTELANRMRGIGSNALATSVVLVCRKREETESIITRAEFIRALKRELPPAIAELQAASIAPADMPQSAIGPGMGVFSRYKAVLESDDSPMTVKAALQLINRELDEYLGGIQGEFDADTRFAITWFEQHGMAKGDYGAADNLARARGISVESVKHAGIIESAAGKVRILPRDELDDDWEPEADGHLTVWECLQHLVRKYEKDGISHDTAVLLKKIDAKAEAVKDLAYCLYDISANKRKDAKEATAYNALIADWTELTRQAAAIHDTSGDRQIRLDI